MCLNKVDGITKKDVKYGYKIFKKFCNELKPLFISLPYQKSFKENDWNIDYRKYKVESYSGNWYYTGYHVFENKDDALDYFYDDLQKTEIHRVEIKRIVASGLQKYQRKDFKFKMANVIVCKKFKILEEIK